MNGDDSDHPIDQDIIEFEKWCENRNSNNLEEYLSERKIDSSLASELRQFFAVEKMMQNMVHPTSGHGVHSDILEGLTSLEGKVLGQYRFLRRLGAGGMGTVWSADQLDPVQRKVAIKLVRPGLDLDVSLKRFAQERQAMASLSHPNIAKVLDAGMFDGDRPFIVMEFVEGVPITDHCDQNSLSLCHRLELFVQLCNAIQYSHQKGLLHRDIKPGNVMVTQVDGQSLVKVIDFGLSKPFHGDAILDSNLTQPNVAIGSPLWMSPEQALGSNRNGNGAVDTRSDIYSLGVILYQLITNTTPIPYEWFREASHVELIEAICEKPTPYPSARLADVESSESWVRDHAGSSLSQWQRRLRNDLDWIARKTLEKEPDRRYATAAALADDVRRFLANEPVIARPPSATYRFRKFARKYRGTIMAAASVATLLLASTIVAVGYAKRAIHQTRLAEQETNRANNMIELMTRQYGRLNVNNPGVQQNKFLLEQLRSQRDEIDRMDFAGDVLTEASFRNQLGRCFAASGDSEGAIAEFEKVVSTRKRILGPDHSETIEAQFDLVSQQFNLLGNKDALDDAQLIINTATNSLGADDPLTLKAETLVLRIKDETIPGSSTLSDFANLATRVQLVCGKDHPAFVEAALSWGLVLHRNRKFKQAASVFQDAKVASEKHWGADHRRTIELSIHYWNSIVADVAAVSANADLESHLRSVTEKFGPNHEFTLQIKSIHGGMLFRTGKIEEGEDTFDDLIDSAEESYGEEHPLTFEAQSSQAYFLLLTNRRPAKARSLLESAVPHVKKHHGEKSQQFLNVQNLLARAWLLDRSEERNARLNKALEITKRYATIAENEFGFKKDVTFDLYEVKAMALAEKNDVDLAIEIFERLVEASRKNDQDSIKTSEMLGFLAFARSHVGESDLAIKNFEEAIRIQILHGRVHHHDCHEMLTRFYRILNKQEDYVRLEHYARMGRDSILPEMKNASRIFRRTNRMLVKALEAQGKNHEASREEKTEFVISTEKQPANQELTHQQ